MKKAKNHITGVVHGLTGKKIGLLKLYEKVCGGATGIVWLAVSDDEPITCMKCRALLLYSKKEKICGA